MATLRTTSVGSFPKPDYLVQARNRFSRGEISREELGRLERRATQECIRLQERLGVDILVHGEMERGDMTTYFAEQLGGFAISPPVRSYGNRYYRKPIVVGPIERRQPMATEAFRFAQSLTDRPVKGMLTGPYTMADWSFNDYYPTRRALVLRMAEVIHEEAVDLERAGARYIQIDEPAISTRPEEIELAIEALGIVTKGLSAHTITHICYGHFEKIYPRMLDLPVDQLDLEAANNDFGILELFRRQRPHKEIALGVVDVHSHVVEPVEQIKRNIERALDVLDPERLYIDPDCGLKTRTWQEAEAKLRNMVEAVRQVKAERGLA
ncbi:methionine synthase [Carboxydochorda subterranea]|uniref:Methionine synthase n=1 Tax=Carboxydichorda subterranea TaxID=3109565 RepID=A0ABZ1BWA5_9FIRM|nr:methionine synthase [Limnochorda sp. L945t]WRP17057.1 methionine synthase [Limnochorda sp. L945t]